MNAQQLKDYLPMVHKHVGIFINTLRKKKQMLGDDFMELARKLAFDMYVLLPILRATKTIQRITSDKSAQIM